MAVVTYSDQFTRDELLDPTDTVDPIGGAFQEERWESTGGWYIDSDHLQHAGGTGIEAYTVTTDVMDAEVVLFGTYLTEDSGAVVRWEDEDNWIALFVGDAELFVDVCIGGTRSRLITMADEGPRYRVALSVHGDDVSVEVTFWPVNAVYRFANAKLTSSPIGTRHGAVTDDGTAYISSASVTIDKAQWVNVSDSASTQYTSPTNIVDIPTVDAAPTALLVATITSASDQAGTAPTGWLLQGGDYQDPAGPDVHGIEVLTCRAADLTHRRVTYPDLAVRMVHVVAIDGVADVASFQSSHGTIDGISQTYGWDDFDDADVDGHLCLFVSNDTTHPTRVATAGHRTLWDDDISESTGLSTWGWFGSETDTDHVSETMPLPAQVGTKVITAVVGLQTAERLGPVRSIDVPRPLVDDVANEFHRAVLLESPDSYAMLHESNRDNGWAPLIRSVGGPIWVLSAGNQFIIEGRGQQLLGASNSLVIEQYDGTSAAGEFTAVDAPLLTLDGTASFTIEWWLRRRDPVVGSTPDPPSLSTIGTGDGFTLTSSSFAVNGPTASQTISGTALPVDQTAHIAVVCDTSTITLYRDGSVLDSDTLAAGTVPFSATADMHFNGTSAFGGLAFYPTALDATTIAKHAAIGAATQVLSAVRSRSHVVAIPVTHDETLGTPNSDGSLVSLSGYPPHRSALTTVHSGWWCHPMTVPGQPGVPLEDPTLATITDPTTDPVLAPPIPTPNPDAEWVADVKTIIAAETRTGRLSSDVNVLPTPGDPRSTLSSDVNVTPTPNDPRATIQSDVNVRGINTGYIDVTSTVIVSPGVSVSSSVDVDTTCQAPFRVESTIDVTSDVVAPPPVPIQSIIAVTSAVLPSTPLLVVSNVTVDTALDAEEQRVRVGSTVVVTTYGQFFVPTTYRASPSSIPIGARGIEGTQIVTSIGDYLVDESGNILIWGG